MLSSVRLVTAAAQRLSLSRASAAAFSAAAGAGEKQDVVVIGGGPGGYVHAIKAAQLGLKVTCVEGRGALGGCCLNVGCIPSKNLLHTTHLYHLSKEYFAEHGIVVPGETSVDVAKMMESKDAAVEGLTRGIEGLFKKNGVTYSQGWGEITGPNTVKVALNDGGEETIEAERIVIATGSDPTPLPFLPFDEEKVLSSTGALALDHIPKTMAVIGGGVIGLEMGSVWSRLGTEVTVIEFLPQIGGPGMDGEIAKNFQRILKRQGINFMTSTKVVGADASGDGVVIEVENKKGKKSELTVEKTLVSVGRRRYADGLGLDAVGVETDERGMVLTSDEFQTNIPSIYAIGDIRDGPMLAHKAEEEGIALAEHFAGHGFFIDYNSCPGVVYTSPELAWTGRSEEELKEAGIEYNVGTFPMTANSRAKACGYTDGLVKILADKKTDRLLGVHILAESASEMILGPTMGLTFGASAEDMAHVFHPHPTQLEALLEAAFAVGGKPIHM